MNTPAPATSPIVTATRRDALLILARHYGWVCTFDSTTITRHERNGTSIEVDWSESGMLLFSATMDLNDGSLDRWTRSYGGSAGRFATVARWMQP